MKRPLSWIFLFLFHAGCQTAAHTPQSVNMLRLICQGPTGLLKQSRIAVLDVDNSKFDFGFATGHAVPTERPCVVQDFSGGEAKVDFIQIPDNYQSGSSTDWAVIRFQKIDTKNLVKYKLQPVNDLSFLLHRKFSFAQARGLPENSQNCTLSILKFSAELERVTHDCRAVAGQSGSPITYFEDGEHRLIGLHIGHLWMHNSPETGRPDRKGYINLLDEDTLSVIKAVITEKSH